MKEHAEERDNQPVGGGVREGFLEEGALELLLSTRKRAEGSMWSVKAGTGAEGLKCCPGAPGSHGRAGSALGAERPLWNPVRRGMSHLDLQLRPIGSRQELPAGMVWIWMRAIRA